MQRTKRTLIPVLAAALAMLFLEGCAGAGGGSPRMVGPAAGLSCPADYTVTCEVRTTGRIHHGSFGKNYDSCACVPNSSHAQTTPVIPRL
jgi:hypothetical protein